MKPSARRPLSIYAANARVWVDEMRRRTGRHADVNDIADQQLDELQVLGVDLLWLLGAWPTGPRSTEIARDYPGLQQDYRRVLPDFAPDDVGGSPYAIAGYSVDSSLGGDTALAALRSRLRNRGIGLMLDFVVNHTGLDHPWLTEQPQLYVQGDEPDLHKDPPAFFRIDTGAGTKVIAHGRDPYFPSWTDTAQLDLLNPATCAALEAELTNIAAQCDGVRCDMAMLALPSIYRQTWHDLPATRSPSQDNQPGFWPHAIETVRRKFSDFIFVAEVYWGMEDALRRAGFQFTYDKTLYERLVGGKPADLRSHLTADPLWQNGCVRFLETHDEVRASVAVPWDRHKAAAVVATTLPGLSLFHDGEFEGRKIKLPIQLRRRPAEPPDDVVRGFYTRLLKTLAKDEVVRRGNWSLLTARPAWTGNPTWGNFIAYAWRLNDHHTRLVVVNFCQTRGQCYVDLQPAGLPRDTSEVEFQDIAGDGGARYQYPLERMSREGLYLDMPAFSYHLFVVRPA